MSMIFVGLFIMVISLVIGFSGLRFIFTAKAATGIVTSLNSRTSSGDGSCYVYAPVVQFEDCKGNSYVHVSENYTSCNESLKAGDRIRVYYRPSDPYYAFAGTKVSFFTFELFALAMGLIILLFGIYDYIR